MIDQCNGEGHKELAETLRNNSDWWDHTPVPGVKVSADWYGRTLRNFQKYVLSRKKCNNFYCTSVYPEHVCPECNVTRFCRECSGWYLRGHQELCTRHTVLPMF